MNCTKCQGSKYSRFSSNPCSFCYGQGSFDAVNEADILSAIVTVRKGLRGLRSSKPIKGGDRAYYVWRLARFHGGKDVTMPWQAGLLIDGDPYRDILDKMSDAVAKEFFGTDLAAAMAWKGLL
jgi:hypothetical protein